MNMIRTKRYSVLKQVTVAAVATLLCWLSSGVSRGDEALPNVTVSTGLKIISMQKQFSGKSEGITVYVLGDNNVAKAFQAVTEQQFGSMKLARVLFGEDLPAEKPDVLFIGDRNKADQAIKYTRENKVLSMARSDRLIPKGVTLTIYTSPDGGTVITMNMSGALLEGIDVNPATLKVARVAK
jgi:hypothetical protein